VTRLTRSGGFRPHLPIGHRRCRARPRPRVPLRGVDAFMLGAGSGLGQTAMSVLTLALRPLSAELGVPGPMLIGAGQAAPVALAALLWWFVRRGGMISRTSVTCLWGLAACGLGGLAGLTLIPLRAAWLFPALAAVCMAAVGTGAAAGYHVQANILAQLNDHEPRTSLAAPESQPAVGAAAGLAQRWTLLLGITSNVVTGAAMARFGVRPAVAGLAVAVAVLAVSQMQWKAMPDAAAGVGRGGVCALIRQSPEVRRDTLGSFILYGAWGALYPTVALLGAGPLVQVWMTGVARGTAAGFVAWLGRLADRDRQRVVRLAATCATAGVVLLSLFRSELAWTMAGLGATITEVGCNGVAGVLKQSLAHGEERVRQTQVGFLFRFAGFGLWPLLVTGLWSLLSRNTVNEARRAVALVLVVLLLMVLAIVPRLVRRSGTHPIKTHGDGKIIVAVFAPCAGAAERWMYVGVAGGRRESWVDERGRRREPGWAFFGLHAGEILSVNRVARREESRLLEFRCGERRLHRGGHDGYMRKELPLAGPGGLPGRALKIVSGAGSGKRVAGKLWRFTVAPITATVTFPSVGGLPPWLRDDLRHAPGEMRQEVDMTVPVGLYIIESPALRGRLRIDSHLFPRRRHA
jgi:hypothetical protein